jgi:hypothetical protein
MVLFHAKDIDSRSGDVTSGGQSDSREEVKADPDAPGIIIREIGYRS